MNDVTHLNIPPKTIQVTYHGQVIHVEFDPEIKLWNWNFTITPHPMTIHGTGCVTPEAALREAKKKVDLVNGTI